MFYRWRSQGEHGDYVTSSSKLSLWPWSQTHSRQLEIQQQDKNASSSRAHSLTPGQRQSQTFQKPLYFGALKPTNQPTNQKRSQRERSAVKHCSARGLSSQSGHDSLQPSVTPVLCTPPKFDKIHEPVFPMYWTNLKQSKTRDFRDIIVKKLKDNREKILKVARDGWLIHFIRRTSTRTNS